MHKHLSKLHFYHTFLIMLIRHSKYPFSSLILDLFIDYVSKLMAYTYLAMKGELQLPQLKDSPPTITSALETKDDAEDVRQRHRSRFS